MTDTLIETPGPEADSLIAEAMGRTVIRADDFDVADHDGLHAAMDAAGYPCLVLWSNELSEYVSRHGVSCVDVGYTTTGDGMLEMTRWMQAKGWQVIVFHQHDGSGDCQVSEWEPVSGHGFCVGETADTPIVAVAKALLAAVEEADG